MGYFGSTFQGSRKDRRGVRGYFGSTFQGYTKVRSGGKLLTVNLTLNHLFLVLSSHLMLREKYLRVIKVHEGFIIEISPKCALAHTGLISIMKPEWTLIIRGYFSRSKLKTIKLKKMI